MGEVEIYIDNQLIDITQGMPMPFTYSVADIREPDKRNTSYSKTITIPGTKRNNKIFAHCFEIDSVVMYLGAWTEDLTPVKYEIVSHENIYYKNLTGTNTATDPATDTTNWVSIGNFYIGAFNPNLKKEVRVYANTLHQFSGYCQLLKVNVTDKNLIEYEVAMVGVLGDILSELGDRTFDDIDLSEWDHNFETDSITLTGRDKLVNSWFGGVYKNGATYNNVTNVFIEGVTFSVLSNITQYEGYRLAITVTPGFAATEGVSEGSWVYLTMPDIVGRYLVLGVASSSTQEIIYVMTYAHPQMAGSGTIQLSTLDSQTYLGEGYTYPLIDFGQSDGYTYGIGQILPAVYTKEYIDKLFELAGYSYTSAFFDSQFFKRLVIPSSVPFFKLSDSEVTDRQWKVKSSGSTTSTTNFNNFFPSTNLNDDSSSGYFDPGGHWDTTNQYWHVTKHGRYNLKGSLNVKVKYAPASQAFSRVRVRITMTVQYTPYGPIYGGTENHILNANDLIGASGYTSEEITFPIDLNNYLFNGATSKSVNGVTTAVTEKVFVKLDVEVFNQGSGATFFHYAGSDVGGSIQIQVLNTSNFYNEVVNTGIYDGDTVELNQAKPVNIKLKDFLVSYIKKYNLYVLPDPSVSRGLLIEPRDDFYEDGTTVDWTDKLDTSQKLEIKPMGELDYKEYRMSYKDDSDKWNKLYKERWRETYGEINREVTNDFVKNKKDYSIIFSPTPSIAVYDNTRIIPQIVNDDGTPITKSFNIRELYYGGVKSCNGWNVKGLQDKSDFFDNTGFPIPFYPYAGHLNDPQNPTLDINFSHPKEIFWTLNVANYTSNNTYNLYHRRMFEEITDKDSKMVTGYFYLTPNDIATLDFRDTFFVDGHHLRLNKVYDYDPLNPKTTKCEFVKVKQSLNTIAGTVTIRNNSGNVETIGSNERYAGNQYNPKNQTVTGKDNNIHPTAMAVSVMGYNNIVGAESSNILIQGSNNYVGSGLTNVTLINTSNVQVTESNVCYLNGVLVQRSDVVDGGKDEVRSDFATSDILIIDGSLNTVRNKFSTSTITILDGGEDTI